MKVVGIIVLLFIFWTNASLANDVHEIQASHNDEVFIINNEKFSAKTYCFNTKQGDLVIFIDGSPKGFCVSAKFFNLNTKKTCKVWCD